METTENRVGERIRKNASHFPNFVNHNHQHICSYVAIAGAREIKWKSIRNAWEGGEGRG